MLKKRWENEFLAEQYPGAAADRPPKNSAQQASRCCWFSFLEDMPWGDPQNGSTFNALCLFSEQSIFSLCCTPTDRAPGAHILVPPPRVHLVCPFGYAIMPLRQVHFLQSCRWSLLLFFYSGLKFVFWYRSKERARSSSYYCCCCLFHRIILPLLQFGLSGSL